MIDQRKTNKQIDQAIGNRIRAIRTSSGKSQEDLAKATELSLTDYARSEAGERRFNAVELFAISQALGIGLVDIVSALER
ncbi:helix-turn-helix domain-containing protein [Hyphomicrobium sp. MC1]|uniref:helix-turn-helix domain-containing protein n=1 Tax=Hyphomicrobium sp. (strain MC1) TaxID=717785 RepID=UPI000213D643